MLKKENNLKICKQINPMEWLINTAWGSQFTHPQGSTAHKAGKFQQTYNFVHVSPVNSSSSLDLHPVQGEVNLPDKGGHSLHNSVGHPQHHTGLLPHNPEEKPRCYQTAHNRNSCPQAPHPSAAGQEFPGHTSPLPPPFSPGTLTKHGAAQLPTQPKLNVTQSWRCPRSRISVLLSGPTPFSQCSRMDRSHVSSCVWATLLTSSSHRSLMTQENVHPVLRIFPPCCSAHLSLLLVLSFPHISHQNLFICKVWCA